MIQLLWKTVRRFLTKLNIQLPNHLLITHLYLPKGVEKTYPHRNLHMDVNISFIHNFQNLEATKIAFSRRTDK
jgi:hypothetical protein